MTQLCARYLPLYELPFDQQMEGISEGLPNEAAKQKVFHQAELSRRRQEEIQARMQVRQQLV